MVGRARIGVKMDERNFFALQWHITNRCDQRCQHCYIFNSATGEHVDVVDFSLENSYQLIDGFIEFCKGVDMYPVLFITGGDPLLHPSFWQIAQYLKERSLKFSLLGNPFHLDDKIVDKLISHGCEAYQVSLDGLQDTHDAIRQQGSFDATVDVIRRYSGRGLKMKVMTTLSKSNVQDLPDLARFVANIGADVFAFARYCPTHGDIDQNIEPSDYRQVLSDMWDVYRELGGSKTAFSLKDHLWKPFLIEEGYLDMPSSDNNIVFDGCHCGISHMTVLEDGSVLACRRCDSTVGSIFQQDFHGIFFGQKMDFYRQIDSIDGCKDCTLLNCCRGCRAVAQCTTDSFYSKDPPCRVNTQRG
jgi:radical SAM/SPASM domain protein of ACGX system